MPQSGINRHNDTSSEEESDGEIVVTTRRKSFGIRVAQTPQQAQQQILSQIGNLASTRQANEITVQQTASHEKTEAEKKAMEQHQKVVEAQQLAKAQQAAALQAAAARVAQAQAQSQSQASQNSANHLKNVSEQSEVSMKSSQEEAKKAQQEALARAQEAQKKAQEEALKKAQQAQAQAQLQAQAQKKAQQEALLKAQEAQKKAQEDAMKKAEQQQKQIEARKKAEEEMQRKNQQAQQQLLNKSPSVGAEAQLKAKKAEVEKQAQNTNSRPQQAQPTKTDVQISQFSGKPSGGELSQAHTVSQEIHAATGPKWSRTPGKVQTQGPQPEQPKPFTAVAPPTGNTALRQTVQIQEQQLAGGGRLAMPSVVAQKPQIQANELAQKFLEKPNETIEKKEIQKGQQLEGAKRWVADSEIREKPVNNSQQMERGPKAVLLSDDACWQTQRRVPLEIQQPQVGKITIPELNEKEIQRTIVAQPASYHKVEWNEFPEEPQYEITAAPKTKTQDWVPVNNELNELQRSIYKPARMSAVWPPPQEELIKEEHSPLSIKANEDTAWIQQDPNGVQKQAVWGKTSRINRAWPPPEYESSLSDFGPQHMPVVQWPPPEAEAHEREQVEVLQKHIPTKKMERQWPPPPPQYQVVESSGEIETRHNPAEVVQEQAAGQQQVIRTVIRSQ